MPHILLPEEISKKYREAIVHYSKYQYAGIIETEASFKATRISIEQNCTLQAASYLNNVILINLTLSEQEKVSINFVLQIINLKFMTSKFFNWFFFLYLF